MKTYSWEPGIDEVESEINSNINSDVEYNKSGPRA